MDKNIEKAFVLFAKEAYQAKLYSMAILKTLNEDPEFKVKFESNLEEIKKSELDDKLKVLDQLLPLHQSE